MATTPDLLWKDYPPTRFFGHLRSFSSSTFESSRHQELYLKNNKPRVNMACKHCRQRKVRCDGMTPSCSLCARLERPCEYVKVTEAENVILREKKRAARARKAAQLAVSQAGGGMPSSISFPSMPRSNLSENANTGFPAPVKPVLLQFNQDPSRHDWLTPGKPWLASGRPRPRRNTRGKMEGTIPNSPIRSVPYPPLSDNHDHHQRGRETHCGREPLQRHSWGSHPFDMSSGPSAFPPSVLAPFDAPSNDAFGENDLAALPTPYDSRDGPQHSEANQARPINVERVGRSSSYRRSYFGDTPDPLNATPSTIFAPSSCPAPFSSMSSNHHDVFSVSNSIDASASSHDPGLNTNHLGVDLGHYHQSMAFSMSQMKDRIGIERGRSDFRAEAGGHFSVMPSSLSPRSPCLSTPSTEEPLPTGSSFVASPFFGSSHSPLASSSHEVSPRVQPEPLVDGSGGDGRPESPSTSRLDSFRSPNHMHFEMLGIHEPSAMPWAPQTVKVEGPIQSVNFNPESSPYQSQLDGAFVMPL